MISRPWLAWAALGIACVAPGSASAATPSAGISFGALQFTPCTLAAPGQAATLAARCSTLAVAEDRSRPDGRRIELAIGWVPSSSKSPAADPVMFLAGGPGQAALESFPMLAPAFREALRQRDVILVDQRGTGRSHRLDCPRVIGDEATAALDVTDSAVARDLARRCLEEIGNADPRFYTTNDYVADLEAVRGALGAESVNLVGVSYGTRVALEYLRRHPGRIRAVVLDSVVPPTLILGAEHARNLDAAVDAQFARCEADVRCRERFGSPRARLDALLARLRATPVTVAYADPLTHERREDELTADALAGVVRLHAYSPPLFAMLPMLIDAATQGRYETLVAQARMVGQLVGEQISVPLQLSVSCAEDAPWLVPDPADRDTMMGSSFVDVLRAQCEVWPRGRVPADFHEPVTVRQPVLLLSGEFDPVTPPRYGEAVARQLPHARHLVLRGQGHGVLGVGCTPRLLGRFLARPEPRRLDTGCLDDLGYMPPFVGVYGWDP
ncbi:MAG TPA: alpha/beta hydrolase [Steroidobacteraceae bacterium]|nr:alpha/beta hydrolase [Steroidobacteraceae bacterium]